MKPPDTPGASPVQLRFRPTLFSTTATVRPGSPGSVAVMLVSVALPPIPLNCTPSQSAVTPLTVRLPPIVLPLIDQGISPPPPVSVTFLLTVTFLIRTVFASVAVTFPLTVMVVCPAGSTAHGTPANMPIEFVGWQPRPRNEPEAAVTLCPTVIVDGALCASSTAPGATLMLPTTLITASGCMLHTPVTVMLA